MCVFPTQHAKHGYFSIIITGSLHVHTCAGKVTINFEKLPECQEYHSWHQLMPMTKSTTSKGTLRLTAIFNVSSLLINVII